MGQNETEIADDGGVNRKLIATGWDDAEKHAKHVGLWLKLEAGDTALVNVFGEPSVHEKAFEAPDGEVQVSTRFSVDVYIPDVGIRIWEMAATTFGELKRRRAKRKDFGESLYTLERVGSGMKTKYSLDFDRVLNAGELAARTVAIADAAARAAASEPGN